MDLDSSDGHEDTPAGTTEDEDAPSSRAHRDASPVVGHARGTAEEGQRQDMQDTLPVVATNIVDLSENLTAAIQTITAQEKEIHTLRQQLAVCREEQAHLRHQLDEERRIRSAMEADLQVLMQQHIKPPPSGEVPVLYAFAGNTSADKYTVRPSSHYHLNNKNARYDVQMGRRRSISSLI